MEEWFTFVYNTADSDLRAHRIALTYVQPSPRISTPFYTERRTRRVV